MNKNGEIVQRIESHYVGNDCIQIMAPYRNSLTVFDKNGITYRSFDGEEAVNKYLLDERRKQFPYSNIPSFIAKKVLKKYKYHNELFNFEEPYIRIVDGLIVKSFAIKDGKEALLLNKMLLANENTKYLTRKELDDMAIQPSGNNEEHLYIMKGNGEFYKPNDPMIFPDEDKIVEWSKNILRRQIEKYKRTVEDDYGNLHFDKFGIECFEKTIENLKVEDLPSEIKFTDDNMLFIRTNGNDIKLEGINVTFLGPDRYKVITYDLPIKKYNLGNLRTLVSNIKTTSEPNISTKLNPGIPKSDIEENIKLVKRLKEGK